MTKNSNSRWDIFKRKINPDENLLALVKPSCQFELNHLLKLADALPTPPPIYTAKLSQWYKKIHKLQNSPNIETLEAELLLDQLAYDLRQIWFCIAHHFSDQPLKSPLYHLRVALPRSYSLSYDYERAATPRRLEEKLTENTQTISGWESHTICFSCGMGAMHSLLQTMPLLFAKTDRVNLKLDILLGYYESDDLIWNSHLVNRYRLSYPNPEQLYANIAAAHSEICIIEPILCDHFQTLLDPEKLMTALLKRSIKAPLILAIDSTLLAGVFKMEDMAALLTGRQTILLIEIRSALKLDQEGLELSNVGYLRIFSNNQQNYFKNAYRVKRKLSRTRNLFGNNLTLEQMALLDVPWFAKPAHTDQHARAIFDNNRQLALALKPIQTHGLINEINHPSLSTQAHWTWAESPFVIISFKEYENTEPNHAFLIGVLLFETQQRHLNLHWGTSFGFRHHRFEIFNSSKKYPSGEYIGVIRIAMGRNFGPSLTASIHLFKELFSYPSFNHLKKAYPKIEPIYKHMPWLKQYRNHVQYLWSGTELKQIVGGTWSVNKFQTIKISGIHYQAEQIKPGYCFILADTHTWGAKYSQNNKQQLEIAIKNGAVAVLSQEFMDKPRCNIPFLMVEDSYIALQLLARANRIRFTGKIAAITGSVGKTSSKALLKYLLGQNNKVHSNPNNCKNRTDISLNLAQNLSQSRYLIYDLNIWKNRVKQLSQLIRPHIALVTEIQPSHLNSHDSIEAIIENKSEIFTHLPVDGIVILNHDCAFFPVLKQQALAKRVNQIITYGEHCSANLRLHEYKQYKNYSHARIILEKQEYQFTIPGFGKSLLLNALAALSTIYAMSLSLQSHINYLTNYQTEAPQQFIRTIRLNRKSLYFIQDQSSVSPISIQYVFESIAALKETESDIHKISLILGDLGDLKQYTSEYHSQLGKTLLNLDIDNIWVYGKYSHLYAETDLPTQTKRYISNKIQVIQDIEEIKQQLLTQVCEHELIVVICAVQKRNLNKLISLFI